MDPVPALEPPPGQISDFTNAPTAMVYVVICFAICLPVTSIAFGLRTWTRIVIKRSWTLEDWMCTFGWTTFVVFCAFVTTLMHNHGGIHEWNINSDDVHQAFFWSNAAMVEYAFCMLTTKLAILMLYQRVFVTRRWNSLDWVIKVMLVVIILFYSATTFVKIFSCTPRARIWDSTVPGTCINIARVLIANGIFNVVTDSLILLIPMKSVWNLQMSTKKKIGVITIFSVGSIAPIFGVVGLVMRLKYSNSPDQTWNQVIVHLWAAAEISTGLICVCAPEIAPIARQYLSSPHSSPKDLYSKFHPRHSRMRDASISLDDVDLFQGMHDAETGLQREARNHVPAVVTGIRGGAEMRSKEDSRSGGLAAFPEEEIGVVTTIKLEHSAV